MVSTSFLIVASNETLNQTQSISSRAKESLLLQQNIAELEILLARASSSNEMSPIKGSNASRPSSINRKMTEEVRQLQEELDKAHKRADEYAKDLRLLTDKSRPSRGIRTAGGRMSPKKSSSMDLEVTPMQLGQASSHNSSGSSSQDILLESISLETALFRPALSSAMQSSTYWKAKAMGSALSKLAPLNNVALEKKSFQLSGDLFRILVENRANHLTQSWDEVALANNEVRLINASLSVVDLSKNDVRAQLIRERRKKRAVELRLQNAASDRQSSFLGQ